jgi:hypothetical protein
MRVLVALSGHVRAVRVRRPRRHRDGLCVCAHVCVCVTLVYTNCGRGEAAERDLVDGLAGLVAYLPSTRTRSIYTYE